MAWVPKTANAQTQMDSTVTTRRRALVDRIVAVVSDSVILYSDLMARVAPMARELEKISDLVERRRRLAKLEGQALDALIDEELIHQEAIEAKLDVTDEQVQMAIDETKTRNGLNDEQFKQALRSQGDSLSSYRKTIRKQILRLKAVNSFARPKVEISDDDIKAHYKKRNRRNTGVSEVHLQHILLTNSKKSAKIAESILEKSGKGVPFAELAATYSQDASTKDSGGDLGWIERNSLPSEWEAIVFAMSPGEVRGPIKSPRGEHLFHVSEVKSGAAKPLAEMKDQIHNELFRIELDRQTSLWLADLKKKFHVLRML